MGVCNPAVIGHLPEVIDDTQEGFPIRQRVLPDIGADNPALLLEDIKCSCTLRL
ncbi:hypothetical protein [Phocaeicola massiliensis]|uniref:hypothetical protein n=1 Tax=Phocaeicola massiliensis TaxID=204516 RepID=UPI0027E498F2|nr:hypothetical protein [Phocaeicola massiliensis]